MRARRTRTIWVVTSLLVLGLVLVTCQGGNDKKPVSKKEANLSRSADLPAAESGLLPWRLAAAISRSVVLPGSGSEVDVLGGLDSSNDSEAAVFSLDTTDGAVSQLGTLHAAVHDAVGALIGGRDVVIGGGSPVTVGTIQAFSGSPPSGTAGLSTSNVIAELPSPRSDASSVTVGHVSYVVGGYDGKNPDTDVLSTRNGSSFEAVAALPVPVRYPAVASLGGKLYVFGGESISASGTGAPVDAVQEVDPKAKKAWIAARLPEPLEASCAFTIRNEIFLAGGKSSAPQLSLPGMGSTQITAPGSGANRGVGANGAITDSFAKPAPSFGPAKLAARIDQRHAGGTVTTTASGPTSTVPTIWSWDPSSGRMLPAGRLQVPVSHAAVTVSGARAWIIGGESSGVLQSTVQMVTPNASFGNAGAPGAGSPYFGSKLLVADRGNNRLLLMDPSMHIEWTYPSASSPPNPLGFYFPDDAFFVQKGSAIISNQEENETIAEIAYPSGKILWSYGHPKQPGSEPGYLHEPDDAYLLRNGQITVADAENCRVLVINRDGSLARQIGTTGLCVHNPPASMGSPNGDTPLADGNLLVSEINGSWVTEYTTAGAAVWSEHMPISYPSDPQQIGPDLYLIADYSKPGEVLEFNREGQISYRYDVASGPGMLDHPSLAERMPNGIIMANDDYRNRMVAIDPSTDALVWQYGINDQAGSGPGMLNTPDGFDILAPNGSTPTHEATG